MTIVLPEQITRVRRDIHRAAGLLSRQEVRYLVDLYYSSQDFRISAAHQERQLDNAEEPASVLAWSTDSYRIIEDEIRKSLDVYTRKEPTGNGEWLRSIVGIGPVIAAGLLANLDEVPPPTVGHWWRFAGLDPTVTWNRNQKRPWNASLKTLCWKAGESFVKVSSNPNDVYGHLYAQRKLYEQRRNESGELAEQAKAALEKRRIGKDTEAYKAYITGKLPPAHIQARAKRWAVKIFLSHVHHVMFENYHKTPPPKPFAIAHLNHVDMIHVPNHTCIELN